MGAFLYDINLHCSCKLTGSDGAFSKYLPLLQFGFSQLKKEIPVSKAYTCCIANEQRTRIARYKLLTININTFWHNIHL